MRTTGIILLALAALAAPAAAAAQDQEVVVRGETARGEIERILEADNLDTARLDPSEVVEIIAGIARGGAPEDFWNAYQQHVLAWARLAEAVNEVRQHQADAAFADGQDELTAAAAAIGTTFDEVERIARVYHARVPRPPIDTRTIA